MRVISVCSGAGGMDLGFHRAGCRTVAMCEVDPWRRRLLAARFPGVPIFPDLTTLDPTELPRADILIGGTPCTDLSVAGRRAGLDGESSRLFWDYCRIRNATGVEWCVWENVAGALSSNAGLDFASVLGAFVGADVPVPAAGWGGAGVVAGPWGGAVWRLLDAQYFGVPQRRRRVFVVGRLGGECPPEVLLESASGGRDSASRRGAWAGVADASDGGVAGTVRSHPRPGSNDWGGIVNALDRQSGGPDDNSAQAGHLVARTLTSSNQRLDGDTESFVVAHTLRAVGFDASEDGTGRGTPLVPVGVPLDAGPDQRGRGAGDGSQVDGERSPDGLDGAPAHGHGVRAPYELAGRVDVAPVTADRCAYDPQPDGRRYAACGDGVVANVAEWIARRLLAVAPAEFEQAA